MIEHIKGMHYMDNDDGGDGNDNNLTSIEHLYFVVLIVQKKFVSICSIEVKS